MDTLTNHTKQKFEKLVRTMDIPDFRKKATQPNLRWFLRNAWIRNVNHPDLDTVLNIAKKYS